MVCRRCTNYIWMINNFIAYKCAAYIRGLKVPLIQQIKQLIINFSAILQLPWVSHVLIQQVYQCSPWNKIKMKSCIHASMNSHHRFRQWLGAKPPSKPMLTYCLLDLKEHTFQWNFIWKSKNFIQGNAFKNVICNMETILSQPQCVNFTTKILSYISIGILRLHLHDLYTINYLLW